MKRLLDDVAPVFLKARASDMLKELDDLGVDAELAELRAKVAELRAALAVAEAALADIGDSDREPGDDLAWCERRAASALPAVRSAIAGGGL